MRLPRPPAPTPAPEPPAVERLLQHLVVETQVRQPVRAVVTGPAGLETLLRTLLSGHLAPAQQPRPGSCRRDWNVVVCFSCGKAGHSAILCPNLDDSFPFMMPGFFCVCHGCRLIYCCGQWMVLLGQLSGIGWYPSWRLETAGPRPTGPAGILRSGFMSPGVLGGGCDHWLRRTI